ncbi:hypothetical protein Tco_0465837 [Tanacetum coccineum]
METLSEVGMCLNALYDHGALRITGEVTGVGTAGDDYETGKEPNDHSGGGVVSDSKTYGLGVGFSSTLYCSDIDLELCPISNVLGMPVADPQVQPPPTPLLNQDPRPLNRDPRPHENHVQDPSSSEHSLSSSIRIRTQTHPHCPFTSSEDPDTSPYVQGDNGVVKSDGAVECYEVILISDVSEASNSSVSEGVPLSYSDSVCQYVM